MAEQRHDRAERADNQNRLSPPRNRILPAAPLQDRREWERERQVLDEERRERRQQGRRGRSRDQSRLRREQEIAMAREHRMLAERRQDRDPQNVRHFEQNYQDRDIRRQRGRDSRERRRNGENSRSRSRNGQRNRERHENPADGRREQDQRGNPRNDDDHGQLREDDRNARNREGSLERNYPLRNNGRENRLADERVPADRAENARHYGRGEHRSRSQDPFWQEVRREAEERRRHREEEERERSRLRREQELAALGREHQMPADRGQNHHPQDVHRVEQINRDRRQRGRDSRERGRNGDERSRSRDGQRNRERHENPADRRREQDRRGNQREERQRGQLREDDRDARGRSRSHDRNNQLRGERERRQPEARVHADNGERRREPRREIRWNSRDRRHGSQQRNHPRNGENRHRHHEVENPRDPEENRRNHREPERHHAERRPQEPRRDHRQRRDENRQNHHRERDRRQMDRLNPVENRQEDASDRQAGAEPIVLENNQDEDRIRRINDLVADINQENIELAADRENPEENVEDADEAGEVAFLQQQHEQETDNNVVQQVEQANIVVNLDEIELPVGPAPQRQVFGEVPLSASPRREDMEVANDHSAAEDEPVESEHADGQLGLVTEQNALEHSPVLDNAMPYVSSPGAKRDVYSASRDSVAEEESSENAESEMVPAVEQIEPEDSVLSDEMPTASLDSRKDVAECLSQNRGDAEKEMQESERADTNEVPPVKDLLAEEHQEHSSSDTSNDIEEDRALSSPLPATAAAPEISGDKPVQEISSSSGNVGPKSPSTASDNSESGNDARDVNEDGSLDNPVFPREQLPYFDHENCLETHETTDASATSPNLQLIKAVDDTENSAKETTEAPESLQSLENAILGDNDDKTEQSDSAPNKPELTTSSPDNCDVDSNGVVAHEEAEPISFGNESNTVLDAHQTHHQSDESDGPLLSNSLLNETTEESDTSSSTEEPVHPDNAVCDNSAVPTPTETQPTETLYGNDAPEEVERDFSESEHEMMQNAPVPEIIDHERMVTPSNAEDAEPVCGEIAKDSFSPLSAETPTSPSDNTDMFSPGQDVAHSHPEQPPESESKNELKSITSSSRKRSKKSSTLKSSKAKKQKRHTLKEENEETNERENGASVFPKSQISDVESVDPMNESHESHEIDGEDSFVGTDVVDEPMPIALGTPPVAVPTSVFKHPKVPEAKKKMTDAIVDPEQETLDDDEESRAANPSSPPPPPPSSPRPNNNFSPNVQQPDQTAQPSITVPLQENDTPAKDVGQTSAVVEQIAETPAEVSQESEKCKDVAAPTLPEEKDTESSVDGAPANEHVEAQPSGAPIVQPNVEPALLPILRVNVELIPSVVNTIIKEPVPFPVKSAAVIAAPNFALYSGMWPSDSATFLNQIYSERACQVDMKKSKFCFNYDVMPPSTERGCGENVRPIVSSTLYTGTQRTAYTIPKDLIVRTDRK